jgi:hypothetical protein
MHTNILILKPEDYTLLWKQRRMYEGNIKVVLKGIVLRMACSYEHSDTVKFHKSDC